MFEDRIYQDECGDATLTEYDKGTRRMMHVMATGTGKTVVIGKLFEKLRSRLPGQMVVLAHTDKLVRQNADKTQKVNPHLKVGIDMGAKEYADPNCDIISASIATLGREGSSRVTRFDWNHIDKLIADEAHHSTGDSYRRVFDAFGSFVPNTHKLTLGFTATPNRPDGIPLSDVYQTVGYVYSIRQAIKDGWLVQPLGYRVKTTTSLAGVSVVKGEYNKTELSAAVDSKPRNEQIVDTWKQYGQKRSTLAYCVDIQHSKDLAQAFKDGGVSAEATWGDDPDQEAKIAAHENGEFDVLCNCNLLTEGYDNWKVSCIILARPTISEILFTQMVGRGLRLDEIYGNVKSIPPGVIAKRDCIVFDVVDNSTRHSLLTLPTLMGIRSELDLQGRPLMECVEEMEAALEQCPSLDLSKIHAIGDLKTTLESINLFEIKFPAEVEQNSELTWFRAVGGGYKMLIPGETKNGWIRLNENALGQWELFAEINEEPLHGVRDSMEAAFKVADEQIRKRVSAKTLACLKREGTWQNKPLLKYPKVVKLLLQLYKGKNFPLEQMTAGQASKLISERLNKWDKH